MSQPAVCKVVVRVGVVGEENILYMKFVFLIFLDGLPFLNSITCKQYAYLTEETEGIRQNGRFVLAKVDHRMKMSKSKQYE